MKVSVAGRPGTITKEVAVTLVSSGDYNSVYWFSKAAAVEP